MIQSLPDDILLCIAEFIIPKHYMRQLVAGTDDFITRQITEESNYTSSSIPIRVFRKHMSELTHAYLKLYTHNRNRPYREYIRPKVLYMMIYLMDPHIVLPPFQETEVKKEKDYYIYHIIQCVKYYKSRPRRESHLLVMNRNLEKEIREKDSYHNFLIRSILPMGTVHAVRPHEKILT